MKKILFFIVILNMILVSCTIDEKSNYFNQELPKDTPLIFAKDIISTEQYYEYPCTFAKDFREFFYGGMDKNKKRVLMYVKRDKNDKWSLPEVISFTGLDEMEPIFSQDSNRLYFSAETEDKKGKPHELYYVERVGDNWSKPNRLPNSINSSMVEYYASSSENGNIYFTREGIGIHRSVFDGEKYCEAEKIGDFEGYRYASHPFVASDESFILFDARKVGGYGSADLYISFKKENGFSEPVNLGNKINTSAWDAMASLSPDGKYLFFIRESNSKRDIYWVKFDIDDYK